MASRARAIGQTVTTGAPTEFMSALAYTGVTQDRRVTARDTTFGHGFSGQPTSQTAKKKTTWFVRDPQGELVSLVTSTGATRYYLTDAQQSVLATLDASNGAATRYLYEPYGQQIRSWVDATPGGNTSSGSTPPDGSQTAPAATGADPNPYRYAGGYYDPGTGFLKFGTRYYMPNLARWTQIDPQAGEPQQPLTMNRYLYAGGNPVNLIDPTGRDFSSLDTGQQIGVTAVIAGAGLAALSGVGLAGIGAMAALAGGAELGSFFAGGLAAGTAISAVGAIFTGVSSLF